MILNLMAGIVNLATNTISAGINVANGAIQGAGQLLQNSFTETDRKLDELVAMAKPDKQETKTKTKRKPQPQEAEVECCND